MELVFDHMYVFSSRICVWQGQAKNPWNALQPILHRTINERWEQPEEHLRTVEMSARVAPAP